MKLGHSIVITLILFPILWIVSLEGASLTPLLQGNGRDKPNAMILGADGFLYITGTTDSTDLPNVHLLGPAHTDPAQGVTSVFVAKVDPVTGQPIFVTLIGGSGHDEANALAVDGNNQVVVAGATSSLDFPVINAWQSAKGDESSDQGDAFVFHLNAAGTELLTSTYLGGTGDDTAVGVAVTPDGEVAVTGWTTSTNFPIWQAFQPANADPDPDLPRQEIFLTKFQANGTEVVFSTYLGGSSQDVPVGVAMDDAGRVLVAGSTSSFDFPVTNAWQTRLNQEALEPSFPRNDGFVLLMEADGSRPVYSTFLGDANDNAGQSMTTDGAGNGVLLGRNYGTARLIATRSVNGYSTRTTLAPPSDSVFLAGWRADGSGFNFWTNLIPATLSQPVSVRTDGSGRIHFLGSVSGYGTTQTSGLIAEPDRLPQLTYLSRFVPDNTEENFLIGVASCESTRWRSLAVTPAGDSFFLTGTMDGGGRVTNVVGGIPTVEVLTDAVLLRITETEALTQQEPLVVLASPSSDDVFGLSQPIALEATTLATALERPLDRIEFYAGAERIATSVIYPFTAIWTNAPLGDHWLTAQAVDCAGGRGISCPVLIRVVHPPVNDDFAEAEALPGLEIDVTGTNLGATSEAAEWAVVSTGTLGVQPIQSVWYQWLAPSNGVYNVTVTGETMIPSVLVTRGTNLDSLFLEAGAQSGGTNVTIKATFRAEAGETYALAVDGAYGGYGPFTLRLDPAHPPTNDDFDDRIVILGMDPMFSGTTAESTWEPEEQYVSRSLYGGSAWWTWTAPEDGLFALRQTESAPYLSFYVFSGTNLTQLTPVSRSVYRQESTIYTFNALSGQAYAIAAVAYQNRRLGFIGRLQHLPPPPNDQFADATLWSGAELTVDGTTFGATAEPEEPSHYGGFAASHSVWYAWSPPTNGIYTISVALPFSSASSGAGYGGTGRTSGTAGAYPALSVYTGHSAAAADLNLVARAETGYSEAVITLVAQSDTTYAVAIDGAHDQSLDFRLHVGPAVPPINDAFVDREALEGASVEVIASNLAATVEAGDPSPITFRDPQATVWWSWTAPQDGPYLLRLQSQGITQSMAVYTGNDLSQLVMQGDYLSGVYGGSTSLLLEATAGVPYSIVISGAPATFALMIQSVEAPFNDNFNNRLPLRDSTALILGTNTTATVEPGEPMHAPNATGESIWWEWTPSKDGYYTLENQGGSFGSILVLYEGSTLASLTPVAGTAAGLDEITFFAQAGHHYPMVADSLNGFHGSILFFLRRAQPPPNDHFHDGAVLTGHHLSTPGSTFDATEEPGEPLSPAGGRRHSVWWHWTAPTHGFTWLYTVPTSQNATRFPRVASPSPSSWFPPGLGTLYPPSLAVRVYTGTEVGALVPVDGWPMAVGDGFGFQAEAGVSYHIAVDDVPADFLLRLEGPVSGAEPARLTLNKPIGSLASIKMESAAWQTNVLQYSTDLRTWYPLRTNFGVETTTYYTDLESRRTPTRYYRVVSW